MAAAKAAGEWAAAAAPAGGDGAGPEQGAGRLCRPLPGPRAGNKDARAPVGRTPARRPPRLRPATPGQAPGRGAGRNGGGKTRACCGQAPFLHPAKLPHAAPDTGWWPRPISSRAEPRAGPAVSHRLTPSPLSRTGPAAAVSSPLLPQTPPAQQLERGEGAERPRGPPAKPSYLGGLPGGGSQAGPPHPGGSGGSSARPLRGGAGAGLPSDWPLGSDGQQACLAPSLWPRRAGPQAADPHLSCPVASVPFMGPVIWRNTPRPEHPLQGL